MNENSLPQDQHKKSRPFVIIAIIVSVVLSVVVFALWFFLFRSNSNFEKPKSLADFSIYNDGRPPEIYLGKNGVPKFIDGTFTDSLVKNEADAISVLATIKDLLKISNPTEELLLKSTDTSADMTYYRFEQQYQTIKVDGQELILSVDQKGKVISLSGTYWPDLNIKINPQIDEGLAKTKTKENLIGEPEILSIEKVVYINEATPVLSYHIQAVDNEDVYNIFLDASTGEILSKTSAFESVAYDYKGSGLSTKDLTITLDKKNEMGVDFYRFFDPNRKIHIIDASAMDMPKGVNGFVDVTKILLSFGKTAIDKTPLGDNEIAGILDKSGNLKKYADNNSVANDQAFKTAITTMYNLKQTYDFYLNTLGRKSYDGKGSDLYAFININANSKDIYFNANWNSITNVMMYGSDTSGVSLAKSLDVTAHEVTHGVSGSIIGARKTNEGEALDESYSDVLGAIIDGQNFIVGEGIAGAEKAFRDFSDPEKTGNPSVKNGENWKENGGAHRNSMVASHAAWLAYNAGAFSSKEEMAKIYYNSLFYLTPNSQFEDSALAILRVAKNFGLSEENITKIRSAFIETKMLENFNASLSGSVMNNNAAVIGAVVSITNEDNDQIFFATETNDKGFYQIGNIPAGNYTIKFESVGQPTKTLKKKIDGKVGLDVDYVLEEFEFVNGEVAFLIDNSGSMFSCEYVAKTRWSFGPDCDDPEESVKYGNDTNFQRLALMSSLVDSLSRYSISYSVTAFDNSACAVLDWSKNTDKVKTAINSLRKKCQTMNGTNFTTPLKTLGANFDTAGDGVKDIILLTDGNETTTAHLTNVELSNLKMNGVKVITICLGQCDTVYLQNIASSTAGVYLNVSDSSALPALQELIVKDLFGRY